MLQLLLEEEEDGDVVLYQLQNQLSHSMHDSTFCATTTCMLLSICFLKLVGNLCFEKEVAVDF